MPRQQRGARETVSGDGEALTLRDRKKIQLRHAMAETAARLFASRGFDTTTLEQICSEVTPEVSIRTLLRYFPTKEDLALAREIEFQEVFIRELAQRGPDVRVLDYWREWVVTRAAGAPQKALLARLRIVEEVPSVAAKMLTLQLRYEDLLADAFAAEAGVDPEHDLHGRLLAGMLVAGNRAAARRWVQSNGRLDLATLIGEVPDWAIRHFPDRAQTASRPNAAAGAAGS